MNRQRLSTFQLKNFYKPSSIYSSKKQPIYYSREVSPNQISSQQPYFLPQFAHQSYKEKPRYKRAHEGGSFENKTIDLKNRIQLSDRRRQRKQIDYNNKIGGHFSQVIQNQNKQFQINKQNFKKQLKEIVIDEGQIFSFKQIIDRKEIVLLTKKANTNQSSPVSRSGNQYKKHSASFMTSITSLLSDTKKSTEFRKKPTEKDFSAIKFLGKGKYSKSYLVREKNLNFICVLKQISKQIIKKQNITDRILLQIKIHLLIKHPNIIQCYGVFETQSDICLILEYAQDGKLSQLVNKLKQNSDVLISHYTYDISMAIQYLHCRKILHRDLKPDSILISNGVIKIFGFGWAGLTSTKKSVFCGTVEYAPPQVSQVNQYNESLDMWGLGVILYQLTTGKVWGSSLQDSITHKLRGRQIDLPSSVSIDLKDMIQWLLKKDPFDRMTLSEIWRHPFIKKYNKLE